MLRTAAQRESGKLFAGLLLRNRRGFNRLQRQFRNELAAEVTRISRGSKAPWTRMQHIEMGWALDGLMDRYYGRYRGHTEALFYRFIAEEGRHGWRTAFVRQPALLPVDSSVAEAVASFAEDVSSGGRV